LHRDLQWSIVLIKVPIHVRVWLASPARVPMSQTRLCVGRHEPGSAESSSARRRLAIGSYVCGWSRARLETMSVSMSKTFMSSDFLTKFLEEYRELPVLWRFAAQIIRTGQSGMRHGIYSCSSRERESLMLICVLLRKNGQYPGII
jgi:hypothetical protein